MKLKTSWENWDIYENSGILIGTKYFFGKCLCLKKTTRVANSKHELLTLHASLLWLSGVTICRRIVDNKESVLLKTIRIFFVVNIMDFRPIKSTFFCYSISETYGLPNWSIWKKLKSWNFALEFFFY